MLTRYYGKTVSSSIKAWLNIETKQIRLFTKVNNIPSFTLAGPKQSQVQNKIFKVSQPKESKEKGFNKAQVNENSATQDQSSQRVKNGDNYRSKSKNNANLYQVEHDPFRFASDILKKQHYLNWENQTAKLVILLNRLAKIPTHNDNTRTERKSIAQQILNLCLPNFEMMNRLDVIMLLWASVKLGIYDKHVLDACLGYIEVNFSELVEQDISNYMFCLAKINEKSENRQNLNEIIDKHLEKMSSKIIQAVSNIFSSSQNEQHITNLIWAADRLEINEIFESKEFNDLFLTRKIHFNNTNFGIIVNSLTHVKFTSIELFEHFGLEFVKRLNTLELQEFVSILRAFCLSNATNLYDLLSRAEPYIEKNLKQFSHEELTAILVAFAVVKLESPVVDQLISQIHDNVKKMSIDCLCKVIWSLAILKGFQQMDFELLMLSRFPNEEISKMRKIDLTQAAQGVLSYLLYAQEQGIQNPQITALQEKYEIMKSLIVKNILIERYQEFSEKSSGIFSVYQTLQSLKLEVIPEFITEIYSIDFGLMNVTENSLKELRQKLLEDKFTWETVPKSHPHPQKTEDELLNLQKNKSDVLLLEINGKHHYVGKTFRLKGSTIRKREQLIKMGYKIVSMSMKKCVLLSELQSDHERALALLDIMLQAYSPADE